jgi:hypothetical protein
MCCCRCSPGVGGSTSARSAYWRVDGALELGSRPLHAGGRPAAVRGVPTTQGGSAIAHWQGELVVRGCSSAAPTAHPYALTHAQAMTEAKVVAQGFRHSSHMAQTLQIQGLELGAGPSLHCSDSACSVAAIQLCISCFGCFSSATFAQQAAKAGFDHLM